MSTRSPGGFVPGQSFLGAMLPGFALTFTHKFSIPEGLQLLVTVLEIKR